MRTALQRHPGEELQGRGHVGMRGAEQRFPELQRPLVKGLRFRVLALHEGKYKKLVSVGWVWVSGVGDVVRWLVVVLMVVEIVLGFDCVVVCCVLL